MKTINILNDFFEDKLKPNEEPQLRNRDKRQGDGSFNAVEFRTRFLEEFSFAELWDNDDLLVKLDFSGITLMGPSFANEAFAYFTQYAKPERIKKKFLFANLGDTEHEILDYELKLGYKK